jgi:hypothetical protein
MILGKKTKDKRRPRWVFAIIPHPLVDGRWIWLQYVWKVHYSLTTSDRDLYYESPGDAPKNERRFACVG